jgi:RHS repeat-associated protein
MKMRQRLLGLLTLLGLALMQPAQAQTEVKYIHTDAFGSIVAITDENRNVIERREYEPYGAQLTPTVADGPGYTGHVQDAATGLVYMQQRYYDPLIGRFLSVDPVTAYDTGDMRHLNRYTYAYSNPYRFTDLDGRSGLDWGARYRANLELHNGDVEAANASMNEGFKQGLIASGIALTLLVPDPTDLMLAGAVGRLTYGLSASRGFSQARRYIEATADNMRRTGGSSGQRTVEFDGRGGKEGAAKLFDRLTGGNSVPRDGGRLGRLGDGSHVHTSTRTLKNGTTETSVRISTERTGSRIRDNIKIRFREKPE